MRPKFELTVKQFIARNRHPNDKPIVVKPKIPNVKDQSAEVRIRIKELQKERS